MTSLKVVSRFLPILGLVASLSPFATAAIQPRLDRSAPANDAAQPPSAPATAPAADAKPAEAPAPEAPKPAAAPSGAPSPASGASVLGDWHGMLSAGSVKLPLVIHVSKKEDGTLTSKLDSPTQGAIGLDVDATAFEDGKLRFKLERLDATYEGTLDKDGSQISGTWSQGPGSAPLTFTRGVKNAAGEGTGSKAKEAPAENGEKKVASDPIKATWTGSLEAGANKMRLVVHLSRGSDGVLTSTIDSPDQGMNGIPVSVAVYKDGKLTLELKTLAARFEGTMNKEETRLTGQWVQGGATLPLVLEPSPS